MRNGPGSDLFFDYTSPYLVINSWLDIRVRKRNNC